MSLHLANRVRDLRPQQINIVVQLLERKRSQLRVRLRQEADQAGS